MTKPEPNTLDIATATLLAPFGIDEVATRRVFGTILAHKADDADLYFQYNRSEGWTLEEGEVKSGTFSIDPYTNSLTRFPAPSSSATGFSASR